jgi:NAD(P)-dependent dehydrogenase (short-subunit alcohol dehydrogenase family)
MPQMDANASVALVTGATSGIGKEIARQLGAAGWSVLVGARDSARGAKAVAEVGGQLLLLDVTDPLSGTITDIAAERTLSARFPFEGDCLA